MFFLPEIKLWLFPTIIEMSDTDTETNTETAAQAAVLEDALHDAWCLRTKTKVLRITQPPLNIKFNFYELYLYTLGRSKQN